MQNLTSRFSRGSYQLEFNSSDPRFWAILPQNLFLNTGKGKKLVKAIDYKHIRRDSLENC